MLSFIKAHPLKSFLAVITLGLFISFAIHLGILKAFDKKLFGGKITLAYTLNYVVAISTYLAFYFGKEKHKESLGYFFLGGSSLKFILFFTVFSASYNADGIISSIEFAAFFVPYSVCLVLETLLLIVLLNNKN